MGRRSRLAPVSRPARLPAATPDRGGL